MRELLPKGPQDRTSTDDQGRATWHSNSVWFHGSWFRTGVVGGGVRIDHQDRSPGYPNRELRIGHQYIGIGHRISRIGHQDSRIGHQNRTPRIGRQTDQDMFEYTYCQTNPNRSPSRSRNVRVYQLYQTNPNRSPSRSRNVNYHFPFPRRVFRLALLDG